MPTCQKIASLSGRAARRNSSAEWFWSGPHSNPSNRSANARIVADANSTRSEANRYRLRILVDTGRGESGAIPVEYLRAGAESQAYAKTEVIRLRVTACQI